MMGSKTRKRDGHLTVRQVQALHGGYNACTRSTPILFPQPSRMVRVCRGIPGSKDTKAKTRRFLERGGKSVQYLLGMVPAPQRKLSLHFRQYGLHQS